MSRRTFTDEELHRASVAVIRSMLQSFPDPSGLDHAFSDAYRAKMDALLRQVRRKRKLISLGKRIAAVFAAMLIGLTSWIAVDTNARAAFFDWIREVYENRVVYRYFGGEKPQTIPEYTLTWLPDGFEVIANRSDAWSCVVYYANPDTGDVVGFEYRYLDEGRQLELDAGDGTLRCETITVDDRTIEYYPVSSDSITNNMIWIDEDETIIFMLNSTMDKTVMLQIIENIK